MQLRCATSAKNLYRKILQSKTSIGTTIKRPPCDIFINHRGIDRKKPPCDIFINHRGIDTKKPSCDIFINHRGIDTKKTIAGLLDDHLSRMGLRTFLDSRNMKPGDRLFEKIDPAIRNCKIGVAVFSPNYCDSYFCLHELALLIESKKRIIPIFCDVKPSQLHVMDYGTSSPEQLQRFSRALEEAKYTVGLTFDTLTGDWSHFLNSTTDAVIKNLVELKA